MRKAGRLAKSTRTPAPEPPLTLKGRLKPGQVPATRLSEMMVEGVGMNAVVAVMYSKTFGDSLDLTEVMAALILATQRVQRNDLGGLEAILAAQVVALNGMFTQLAATAWNNLDKLDVAERCLRLALRAQGQCRATGETVAVIKNPPVFARQANIAAGPQQVNNAAQVNNVVAGVARAPSVEVAPNKLLLQHVGHDDVDSSPAGAAVERHPAVAPMGEVHRTPNGKG